MTHLQFAQPLWLWVGAFCCAALIVLFVRATRLRGRALSALAGPRFVTTISGARRATKQALVLVGVAATFVCLARPLAGFRWEEERQEGTDVMFAVDTSKSMLTPDLRPDRLTRAKLAVSDLLREFPGERAGLIAFAGDAFVQAPMTIDHEIFGEALDTLDTSIIARGGTNVAAPIRAAIDAMATEPDRHKVLVLLSDGEDLQGEAVAAARDAARAGLVIYTVGVGTSAGDLVPVERDGVPDVMRDADGQAVHSRLDEQTLREVAAATGGAYAALGPSGRGLETLYREHLAQLPRRAISERMHKIYTERFQIPLAIALGCLLLELALGERRSRRAAEEHAAANDHGIATRGAVAALGGLGLALLTLAPRTAAAAEPHDAKPSVRPTSVSSYNDGTAAYRKKDFSSAQRQFQEATHTTDMAVQQDAYYDLGNARYRVGQVSLTKDRAATIEAWKSAVAAYDGAIALQPKDADARFNRDLVKKRLAALEEQERQKQDQKSKDQNQPNQKNQQGQQNNQNQQSQKGQTSQQDQPNQPSKQDQKGQASQQGQQGQQSKESQSGTGKTPSSSAEGGAKGQQQNQADGPDEGQNPTPNPRPGQAGSPPGQNSAPQHQGPGVISGQPGQRDDKAPSSGTRREPGALSASEAEQLLDSANADLRRMPVAGTRQKQPSADDPPTKDW